MFIRDKASFIFLRSFFLGGGGPLSSQIEENVRKKVAHLFRSTRLILSTKRLPNGEVGVATGVVFQETRSGAGFKTGDCV